MPLQFRPKHLPQSHIFSAREIPSRNRKPSQLILVFYFGNKTPKHLFWESLTPFQMHCPLGSIWVEMNSPISTRKGKENEIKVRKH